MNKLRYIVSGILIVCGLYAFSDVGVINYPGLNTNKLSVADTFRFKGQVLNSVTLGKIILTKEYGDLHYSSSANKTTADTLSTTGGKTTIIGSTIRLDDKSSNYFRIYDSAGFLNITINNTTSHLYLSPASINGKSNVAFLDGLGGVRFNSSATSILAGFTNDTSTTVKDSLYAWSKKAIKSWVQGRLLLYTGGSSTDTTSLSHRIDLKLGLHSTADNSALLGSHAASFFETKTLAQADSVRLKDSLVAVRVSINLKSPIAYPAFTGFAKVGTDTLATQWYVRNWVSLHGGVGGTANYITLDQVPSTAAYVDSLGMIYNGMWYKAAATKVVQPVASSLIHDSIYLLKAQIADLYSRVGGGSPVTKVTDTLAKINCTPMAGYTQSGWQNIEMTVTGDVSLLHSTTINLPTTPVLDGDETGETGAIWPDNVSMSYWRLNQGAVYTYKMALKGISSYDSLDIYAFCSRATSGTRPSYFKWNSRSPQTVNACLNFTTLVKLDNVVPTGTDTLSWYTDGTNYAYLNGMVIIGYHH